MKIPRRANVITGILLIISAAILIITIIYTLNIRVLKDWRIELPAGQIHAGDTIVISSLYTKLKPVTGVSTRNLYCKDSAGNFIRYKLGSAQADNSPGNTGTGIVITLPTSFADRTTLPTTCYFGIHIDYRVYPWRTVTEFTTSKKFTLLPVSEGAQGVSSQAQTVTGQSSTGTLNQSYTNNNPAPQTTQPNTSQPTVATPAQSSSPSLIRRILSPITNLIGGL